jgi:membrane protease YdiL (CAAX protease family)
MSFEVLAVLLPFLMLAGVFVLANLEAHNAAFRWLTYIALILLNLTLLILGLIGFLLPQTPLPGLSEAASAAYGTLLRAMAITGLVAFMPLIRPVRSLLAQVLFIDPNSTVHATALVYAIYLVGLGLGQQPLLSDPEALEGLGGISITGGLAWAQAVGLILIALAGIGTLVRRDGRQTLKRLGIESLPLRHLGIAGASIVVLLVLQTAVSLGWQAWDPEGFAQIEDASNLLLGGLTGLGGALTIGLSAALGEEMVFRGALQPRFRLLPTALLFTIVHSQYGLSPATLLILGIALILGILRDRTSLTVAILVHFGYNFLSVLLPGLGQ